MNKEQLEKGTELDIQYEKRGGRVPVVIKAKMTGSILLLYHVDEEAVRRALNLGYVGFRNGIPFCEGYAPLQLTTAQILVDCDQDALVWEINDWQSYDSLMRTTKDPVKFDENGLAPVMVQDVDTDFILMLGYANQDALDETIRSGHATFWSTSRNELWIKGLTSGDVMNLEGIRAYHDENAVLYRVAPSGGACHTRNTAGQTRQTCFYRRIVDGKLEFLPGME